MKRYLALIAVLATLVIGGATAAAPVGVQQGAINHVIGDVVVPAGTVVQGNVAVAVGNVRVDGTVTGSVSVGVGNVVVNGDVIGDVHVGVGRIVYGPQGKVSGATQIGMEPAPGRFPRHMSIPFALPFADFTFVSPIYAMLRWLGSAAVALAVVSLFPEAVAAVVGQVARKPARAGLIGLAAFVLALPVFVGVAITIIGIPIAVLAAIALGAAVFFGYVAVSVWVGGAVLAALRGPGISRLWAVLAGSFLLALARLVPFLGGLVSMAVSAIGLGAILMWRFHSLRDQNQPPGV